MIFLKKINAHTHIYNIYRERVRYRYIIIDEHDAGGQKVKLDKLAVGKSGLAMTGLCQRLATTASARVSVK